MFEASLSVGFTCGYSQYALWATQIWEQPGMDSPLQLSAYERPAARVEGGRALEHRF